MQSGNAFTSRSFKESKQNSQFAKAAAELFGCPTRNSKFLVNCLRNISDKKLVKCTSIFNSTQWFFKSTWVPTNEAKVEGAYLTENPYDLLDQKRMKDLPWMTGLATDEGLSWVARMYKNYAFKKNVLFIKMYVWACNTYICFLHY